MENNINVHSLEFWEKVKKQYQKTGISFLCSSKLFKEKWELRSYEKEYIRELAETYLKDTCKRGSVGTLFLFYGVDGYEQTRVEFLDWCIERFSKELKET